MNSCADPLDIVHLSIRLNGRVLCSLRVTDGHGIMGLSSGRKRPALSDGSAIRLIFTWASRPVACGTAELTKKVLFHPHLEAGEEQRYDFQTRDATVCVRFELAYTVRRIEEAN